MEHFKDHIERLIDAGNFVEAATIVEGKPSIKHFTVKANRVPFTDELEIEVLLTHSNSKSMYFTSRQPIEHFGNINPAALCRTLEGVLNKLLNNHTCIVK